MQKAKCKRQIAKGKRQKAKLNSKFKTTNEKCNMQMEEAGKLASW